MLNRSGDYTNRDDDLEEIVQSARRETGSSTRHIVVMLSLICKAVRDLQLAALEETK